MTSIVIPVGPYESNKKWLQECIDSVIAQTKLPTEVIVVDDGADLYNTVEWLDDDYFKTIMFRPVVMPWHTGISHTFNYGIAMATSGLVMMLGSDDTLEPTCLEKVEAAWEATKHADGYYSVPIKYMDTDEVQTAPCNAAAITKGFFKRVGGFPIETAIGMGDNILLSICLAHNLPVYWVGNLVGEDLVPLYNYRRHPDIHTFKLGKYFNVIEPLRDTLTRDWNEEEVKGWSDKYGI